MRHLTAVFAAAAVLLIASSAFALRVGQRAPEIGLADLNGNRVTLSSLRGNVVLVDFMASWCEPCAEEMPVLERLYGAYRGQGLRIVAVSQDRQESNIQAFVRQHPVSFPVVHDGAHGVAGRYRPPRMPSSFLIDRNGVVRYVHEGYRSGDAARIEAQIRRLL